MDKPLEQRILVNMGNSRIRRLFVIRLDEAHKRTQFYVHVPVLQHFVVEVLAGEIGVEGQQSGKTGGGVRKRHFSLILFLAIFFNLALGGLVILL